MGKGIPGRFGERQRTIGEEVQALVWRAENQFAKSVVSGLQEIRDRRRPGRTLSVFASFRVDAEDVQNTSQAVQFADPLPGDEIGEGGESADQ